MVVVMMIPAIVAIVIAVRAVMMMDDAANCDGDGYQVIVPDRLACRQWAKNRKCSCLTVRPLCPQELTSLAVKAAPPCQKRESKTRPAPCSLGCDRRE